MGAKIKYGNVVATQIMVWQYYSHPFKSLDQVLAFLNNGNRQYIGDTMKTIDVALNEKELICIYNLESCEKINLELKTDHKKIEKHVKIEEEKWIERKYIIKL